MNYTKTKKIRVLNFESIEDATIEFDERNIIILKGYNDSGKSAIAANALRVLFYNWQPSKQLGFIQDGKEFFRIIHYDVDGIIVIRDKYTNGASLYAMYKDEISEENCIYTTMQNGQFTPFDAVPDVIAKYFGVASFEKMYLNARERNDKMLLVDTSGSENYKFFNEILHSDELSLAQSLLNSDKNKKSALLNTLNTELGIYQKEYNSLYGITEELISVLDNLDNKLTENEIKEKIIIDIDDMNTEYEKIVIIPTLDSLEADRLRNIDNIFKYREELFKPTAPILNELSSERLSSLLGIISGIEEIKSEVCPVLPSVIGTKLVLIAKLSKLFEQHSDIKTIEKLDNVDYARVIQINKIEEQLSKINSINDIVRNNTEAVSKYQDYVRRINGIIEKAGIKTVKCDNCGNIVSVEV